MTRRNPLRSLLLLLSALLLLGLPATAEDCGTSEHPSGKDRCVEAGGSGTQGDAQSDPDDDTRGPERTNGGADEPGGPGGENPADQDGNNGCGNDQDFEDDNEGLCGDAPQAQVTPAREQPAETEDHGRSRKAKSKAVQDTDDADVAAGNGRRNVPAKGGSAAGDDNAVLGGGGIGTSAVGSGVGASVAAAASRRAGGAAASVGGDAATAAGNAAVARASAALAATGAPAEVLVVASLLLIGMGIVMLRKAHALN